MAKSKAENLDLGSISDMLTLATDIGKFIKENRLFQNVQGKEYVNVEGWMYAGSRLGLTSYTEDVWDISTDGEIKYKAKVVVERIEDGRRVGQGFAVCSNKEQGKKYYQEYAILSMAQTRGVGKAYRMFLAQLIRMAGFEPTPAEEMDYEGNEPPKPAKVAPAMPLKKGNVKNDDRPEVNPSNSADFRDEQRDMAKTAGLATQMQKESILSLIENGRITSEEKEKALKSLDSLNMGQADRFIKKLESMIDEREGNE